MNATPVPNAIPFCRSWVDRSTGLLWLVSDLCLDFEAYEEFPRVVEFEGKRFVKTGWNSDFGNVYYRQTTDADLIGNAVH